MKLLNTYTSKLDSSKLDYGDYSNLRDELNRLGGECKKEGTDEEHRLLTLEYEQLHFSVSMERGIEPASTEGRKLPNGAVEILVQWPDITKYADADFEYILKRFDESKNDYIRYKYGIFLIQSKKKRDNQFVAEVLKSMFALMDAYYAKAIDDKINKKKHYVTYLTSLTKDVFLLAHQRRNVKEMVPFYKQVRNFIYDKLSSWDKNKEGTRHLLFSYTRLLHEHFSEFSEYGLKPILKKNWEIAVEFKNTDNHNAIDIAKNAVHLAAKLKEETDPWYRLCADCYVAEAEKRKGMVAPKFYISAIKYYKLIGDEQKVNEIHEAFTKAKKEMNFGKMSFPAVDEFTKAKEKQRDEEVSTKEPEFLLKRIAYGEMIPTFSMIKKMESEDTNFSLSRMLSVDIYDKHGNNNITIGAQSEDDRVSFYQMYELLTQIDLQIHASYFYEAVRANKITAEFIIKWLSSNTWYGEEIVKVYNGFTRKVVVAKLLDEPIKLFFSQLNLSLANNGGNPSYVCSIDSLTPKVEYILRLICEEKFKILTSRIKEDGTVEEKTFGILMSDIFKLIEEEKNLEEEDKTMLLDHLIFVDFIMNSKAGPNIRNVVAHAHLDLEDYSPDKAVLVLSVLLRIAILIKKRE